jgi:hypothetical protein
MIPKEYLHAIEHPAFAARLGVVSTFARLERQLPKDPAVQLLLSALNSPPSVDQLVTHSLALLSLEHDHRFAHPHDLAVAIYIWALDLVAPGSPQPVVDIVLGLENTWWSRAIAQRLGAEPSLATQTTSSQISANLCGELVVTSLLTTTASSYGRVAAQQVGPRPASDVRRLGNSTAVSASRLPLFDAGYSLRRTLQTR